MGEFLPTFCRHGSNQGANIDRRAPARNGAATLACLVVLCLAGCSVSMPLGSLVSSGHPDDETSTISNEKLSDLLAGEDWDRAKAALAAALDPQGTGAAVRWSNPASGAKGSFAADGKPYPSEAGICRAFVADIDRRSVDNALHGTACADKAGEWTVTSVKPAKKS
ncbi:MAG: RT0821/Lpp0805 family surface protein [Beijerinckiaceae bacterium]